MSIIPILAASQQAWYGVTWDEVADSYTRTGATRGRTKGVTLADSFLPIQASMRRCLVADDGTVNYYLSATDSTKKEDGVTASVLTGADGQVMVEIPKFYYRYGYTDTIHKWEISTKPLSGFEVHPAFLSDATELSTVYVGAYEGVLYDNSATKYTNGLCQTAFSCTFAEAKTITAGSRTAPFKHLVAGDMIVVTGTVSNNATFTVVSSTDTVITVSEAVANETAANTVVQIQTDVTATTGDKLSSVSGFAPICGTVSNGTRAHFRVYAANRGAGWSQMFTDVESAIQLLYLTEYASFYSQSVLGAGISAVTDWATWTTYNNNNPIAKTGNGNAIGNASGNTAGAADAATEVTKYVQYRGIEQWYGHIWKWRDGFNVNNDIPYICNNIANFADNTATNYTRPNNILGAAITMGGTDGFQATLAKTGRAFMPLTVGASGSTKITDYYYQSTGWMVASSGTTATGGVYSGAFCLGCFIASTSLYQYFGSRLCFRK